MSAGQNRERPARRAAVALGYTPGQDEAPRVMAAGQGELAEALLRIAREHGVPTYTDHPLANALVRLDVGEQIPPELYTAVAEVLAFLWRLEQEQAQAQANKGGGSG